MWVRDAGIQGDERGRCSLPENLLIRKLDQDRLG